MGLASAAQAPPNPKSAPHPPRAAGNTTTLGNLQKLGFSPEHFGGAITSGEVRGSSCCRLLGRRLMPAARGVSLPLAAGQRAALLPPQLAQRARSRH